MSDSELPIVLCGPQLRRTSPDQVCVWLALREGATVMVEILEALPLMQVPPRRVVLGRSKQGAIPILNRLYITLVVVKPEKPLPVDTVLAYDIQIELGDERQFEISKLVNGLAYFPFTLPTFVLRRDYPINILHGSCRKPHGRGPDVMPGMDALLAKSVIRDPATIFRDPKTYARERPSALYLTGDQIYADDVDKELSLAYRNLAQQLTNSPTSGSVTSAQLAAMSDDWLASVPERAKLLTGISSEEKNYHLITFAEFAAMYLLVWNPSFAPTCDLFPVAERLAIRRLLANIPVYMLCDDHEVTDDWNISQHWIDTIAEAPNELARKIVTNGVASYWLFQGWGNRPDASPIHIIVKLGMAIQSGKREQIDQLLKPLDFSYVTPHFPPVAVLDTRRHRNHGGRDPKYPSALLDYAALQRFAQSIQAIDARAPLFLVLAAPLIGPELEELGKHLMTDIAGPNFPDYESWEANPRAGLELRSIIANHVRGGACIIMSGDVHFSSLHTEEFSSQKTPSAFLVQFTSSALKNAPIKTEKKLMWLMQRDWRTLSTTAFYTDAWDALKRELEARKVEEKPLDDVVRISYERLQLMGVQTLPDARQARAVLRKPMDQPSFGQIILFNDRDVYMYQWFFNKGLKSQFTRVGLKTPKNEWYRTPPSGVPMKAPDVGKGGFWFDGKSLIGKFLFFDFPVNETRWQPHFQGPFEHITALCLHPQAQLWITGRASETGPPANNWRLSMERADLFRRKLLSSGVAPSKIGSTEGFGATQPLARPPDGSAPPAYELAINRSALVIVKMPFQLPRRRLGLSTSTLHRRWGIKLIGSREILKEAIKFGISWAGLFKVGRLAALNERDEEIENHLVIAGCLGFSIDLLATVDKKPKILQFVESFGDWLRLTIDEEPGGLDKFSTTKPCAFSDFHHQPFVTYGDSYAFGIGYTTYERLRFLSLKTDPPSIDTGGWELLGVGVGGEGMFGILALPDIGI